MKALFHRYKNATFSSLRGLSDAKTLQKSAVLWFVLAILAPMPAYAACQSTFDRVVAHLRALNPFRTQPPALAVQAPRAVLHADVLAHIDELPNEVDRTHYRELITAARRQDPPIRDLETYERVVFQAVLHHGDPDAILRTRIPLNTPRSGRAVQEMLAHLESHPPCSEWSMCGASGRAALQAFAVAAGVPPAFFKGSFASTMNELGGKAVAEHAALHQQLQQASETREISYEQLIRSGVEFARLNYFSMDVRDVIKNLSLSPFSAGSGLHYVLSGLLHPQRQTPALAGMVVNNLLAPDRLDRSVIAVSTHPFGPIEIAPPGFMNTPIEVTSGVVIRDQLETPLSNIEHDEAHRDVILNDDSNSIRLSDLSSQRALLMRWDPVDRLRAELRGTRLSGAIETIHQFAYRSWHETGVEVNLAEYYLSPSLDQTEVQEVRHHMERSPRWSRLIEEQFRAILALRGNEPNQLVRERSEMIGRYFDSLLPVVPEGERWNALVALSGDPARMDRERIHPLKQRMIRAFVEAYR